SLMSPTAPCVSTMTLAYGMGTAPWQAPRDLAKAERRGKGPYPKRLHSGGPKLDWLGEALEPIVVRLAGLELGARALIDRGGEQDLVGGGGRLGARGDVHHRSDGGQIVMRAAELAKVDLSGIDADPNPDRLNFGPERVGQKLPPRSPPLLNRPRRPHRRARVVGAPDGEIELCQGCIAHRLV